MMKTAIAIGAHPDDIEFMMSETLLLVKNAGYEIHYMNLASGNCGSIEHNSEQTRKIRIREGKNAAEILGAHYHLPLCNDLEIMYDTKVLRRLTATIREVKPHIVLTHSPSDYMEDHTNTCRLFVTATFARAMPNFRSSPARKTQNYDCTVYHCIPHGLTDSLRRKIVAGAFVNTTSIHETKLVALKAHKSQQSGLNVSQKLNSYLKLMEENSIKIGLMSKKFKHAEGWRRHLSYGFCTPDADPLTELGKDYLINEEYEQRLEKGD